MSEQSTAAASELHLPTFVTSLLPPLVAGGVGAIATNSSVKTWYPTLAKPSWTPPSGVFGPVWTTLYIMMGIAEYLVRREDPYADAKTRAAHAHLSGRERIEKREAINSAVTLYRVQLVLNLLWSVLFFARRSPFWALIEIVALWIVAVATAVTFWRVSKVAALLLVPYILWTTFAVALNAAIWAKNR